jgi:hypothetical protein
MTGAAHPYVADRRNRATGEFERIGKVALSAAEPSRVVDLTWTTNPVPIHGKVQLTLSPPPRSAPGPARAADAPVSAPPGR